MKDNMLEKLKKENEQTFVSKTEQKKHIHTITRFFVLFAMLLTLACAPAATMHIPGTLTAQAASSVSKKTVAKKANAIVVKKTNTTDSATMKLRKLFKYVEKNWGYSRAYGFDSSVSGWTLDYAYSAMKNKSGSCYHFAAGYAYLARQALGSSSDYKVRIAVGQTTGFGNGLQSHAWVEIKIKGTWYIYDPNMDKFAADSSLTYYKQKRSSSAMKKIYNNYKNVEYFTVSYIKTS